MEKRTLLGWIFDFIVFAFFAWLTIDFVRFLGGSELLAGGVGVLVGIFFSGTKDKILANNL
jgi:hypothetical protein